nr:protein DA1-related 1-like [Ipomoea batatas]GME21306.1 protein DA1-related 1-like [Ipomoea batatas]
MRSNCLRSNWGQSYCQKHAFDGTPTCSACSRFKMRNVEFFSLNDGRMLCPDCHSTAVIDPESFKSIVSEVHNFYAALNMHIRKDIPVHLVDLFEMNKLAPHQTGMEIEVRHHCTVTGMTVLYGLPRLLTGRILAHEFMHTWMRLQGYNNAIGTWVEEGMCEVMAYVWLDWNMCHVMRILLKKFLENQGTLFSIICGIRQYLGHLTKEHHVGFEAAAWYWHFVDVVRLFPFVSIYWWGGI